MPGPYPFKKPELIPTLSGKAAVIPTSDSQCACSAWDW